ncbi:unnamed protein product, partial [Discosporangium mesarthrocarpum]
VADIVWVLTVPAIWDDCAKNLICQASHMAELVASSEADCVTVSAKERPKLCWAGVKFMIVDCGGGTVDATTHEVLGTFPLRLRELSPPVGGPCG